MKIMETLHNAKKYDTFYDLAKTSLNEVQEKSQTGKNKYIFGWTRPTRWDKQQGDRELTAIDFWDGRLYFRKPSDTKASFYPTVSNARLSECSRIRNFAALVRARKMSKYFCVLVPAATVEDMEKIFGRLFYCIRLVYDDKLYVWDFVQHKKTVFEDYYTGNGWYYNPRFDKDKVLEWWETDFTRKYVKRCARCDKFETFAYDNEPTLKLTEVDGNYYCDNCLVARNYGKSDISDKMGFRTKLKFSCKEDKKAVFKKLKVPKGFRRETLNVVNADLNGKNIRCCDNCGCFYVYKNNENLCGECRFTMISNYGDKRVRFFRTKDEKDTEKMFYGTECEIEVNGDLNNCSKILNKHLGDLVYLKSDGSIHHGFEIVSYALTYNKWYKSLKKFKDIYQQVVNKGGYSEAATTTGLHIHLSRDGFADKKHLARFASCFYLDKDLSRVIACREFNHYAQWNDYRHSNPKYFEGNLYNLYDTFDDRYHIVNFQNSKTVEIRMFNGTLRMDVIFAYIQFCKLLVDYTRDIESVNLPDLLKFLRENAKSKILRSLLKLYDYNKKYSLKEVKKCV